MASVDYGVDLSCGLDLNPMLLTVTGTELMNEVCMRRLFGRPGSTLSNPVDNTLDVRDFIAQGISPRDLPTIQGRCVAALEGDQRIYSATVSASFDPNTNILTLAIAGNGAFGPFNLTLAVSAVTVEVLRA
jgi:hypothetical protein